MQNNTELKLRILYGILNSFKRKIFKMEYTSVEKMGQMNVFKEKKQFNA